MESFRRVEDQLHIIRRAVMERAAKLAAKDSQAGNEQVYSVMPQHVDKAFDILLNESLRILNAQSRTDDQ